MRGTPRPPGRNNPSSYKTRSSRDITVSQQPSEPIAVQPFQSPMAIPARKSADVRGRRVATWEVVEAMLGAYE